jgi:sortase A
MVKLSGSALVKAILRRLTNRFRGETVRSSVLRLAQRIFLGVGLVTLAYAGGTIAYAEIYQWYLSWELEQKRDIDERIKTDAIATAVGTREGDLVGKLEIPRIGISVIVLEGVGSDTLRLAAGHVPGTALPGTAGNAAIAAHRDTFFRKLQRIRPDDRIQVSSVGGTYEYVVDSTEIVDPENIQVLDSGARPELTLVTCYPFYFVGSAPKRFIVHSHPAKLTAATACNGLPNSCG